MHFRSQKKSAQDVSLSDYIETGADGTALELMDVVGTDEDMLEAICSRQAAQRVQQAVEEVLTEQEQIVIRMRYGMSGYRPSRQREVADRIGLSRSYVSRIEKRALEKLRTALEK